MIFKITSAGNNSSFGDVFYTRPVAEEIKKAERKVIDICNKRVKELYKGSTPKVERMVCERLNNELEKMCATESVYHFLILKEIAKISRKSGYPIITLGNLSGTVISYLLGITEYNPFSVSVECHMPELIWGTDEKLVTPDFTTGIARQIRPLIHKILDSKYGFVVCNNEIFKHISLVDVMTCEMLGVLSSATGKYPSVSEFNNEVYLLAAKNIADDCIEEMREQKKQGYINEDEFLLQYHFIEEVRQADNWDFSSILRLYAYTKGSFNQEKSVSDLNNGDFFVTRDEFFNRLISHNVPIDVALDIVKKGVWSTGTKREKYIQVLEAYDVPDYIRSYFSNVTHLWTSSACVERVLHKCYMAWYQEN